MTGVITCCNAGKLSTIGGGVRNCATGGYSTIGGGINNTASGIVSTISGGINNIAVGNDSFIGGGAQNNVSGDYSTISGGYTNTASGNCSSIIGGYCNKICSHFSVIGGGNGNNIYGNGLNHSFIGGGEGNVIRNNYSGYVFQCNSIVGGHANYIHTASLSFIGGGNSNYIRGYSCCLDRFKNNTIVGGIENIIKGNSTNPDNYIQNNFIGGGTANRIYSTCTGNVKNNAIVTGLLNKIIACELCNNSYNFIGGGRNNYICHTSGRAFGYNTIIGGNYNVINSKANAHLIGAGLTATTNDYSFMNNLCVIGNVVKGGGSFSISHPNPAKTNTHKLIHSFVESPTAGDNIYRYEVEVKDGVAIIDLPEYYKYLNENTQIWVTAKNGFGMGYGIISEDLKTATIYADKDLIYNILIIGTRKDKVAKDYWKGVEVEKSEAELQADVNRLKAKENKLNT